MARPGLSTRLLELRERHDPPLTQKEAAELIGVSLRQYGRLERGQADATLHTIRRIAAAYRVEPRLLTGVEDEVPASPTYADLARLEHKLELLLDHFGLSGADERGTAADLAAALRGAHRVSVPSSGRRRIAAPRTPA